MNRPFGAVDVSANLKGAVPKTATQKILVALAEKGELVQKTYGTPSHSLASERTLTGVPGKTTFFVANQANLEDMPAEKLKALEAEHKSLEESNKTLAAQLKAASAGTFLRVPIHAYSQLSPAQSSRSSRQHPRMRS